MSSCFGSAVFACGSQAKDGSETQAPAATAAGNTTSAGGDGPQTKPSAGAGGTSAPARTATSTRASSSTAASAGTNAGKPTNPSSPAASSGDVPSEPQASAGSSAAGSGAAVASAGAGGNSGAQVPSEPDVACDPAGKSAAPVPVEFAKPGEGPGLAPPTGDFKPIMEADPGIPTHTIIRPDPLGKIKHPILAWGEGGCGKSGNIGMFSALFQEFASHGVLVVADGPPGNGPTMAGQDGKPLIFGLEWAIKENERPCSQYYHKLDVTKLAVSGQSCGGLMAINAATDPRITTAFPYDSGLFARDQAIYDALHSPMAIFDGGEDDIAYANGLADFMAIDKIPMLFANPTSCSSNAHVCTFFDANAGEFGRAGVAWINWHLLGDEGPTGKGMFVGDQCGLCGDKWTLMWKNEPK